MSDKSDDKESQEYSMPTDWAGTSKRSGSVQRTREDMNESGKLLSEIIRQQTDQNEATLRQHEETEERQTIHSTKQYNGHQEQDRNGEYTKSKKAIVNSDISEPIETLPAENMGLAESIQSYSNKFEDLGSQQNRTCFKEEG